VSGNPFLGPGRRFERTGQSESGATFVEGASPPKGAGSSTTWPFHHDAADVRAALRADRENHLALTVIASARRLYSVGLGDIL
jgi:hypothetical protein